MILYYSGCGNSRWVAQQIAHETNDNNLLEITKLKDKVLHIEEGEKLGFVFPVYAWAPPTIIKEFVKGMSLSGKPSFIFMICTCGDNVGVCDKVFEKQLMRKGLELDSAFSVIMPETYINLPGFALDSIENGSRKINHAESQIREIAHSILNGESKRDLERGKMPWMNSHIVNWLFNKVLITDKKFHVEEQCNSCSLCSNICPIQNITMKNGKPSWNGNCMNCMACYHYCPQNAIHFGKQTYGKGQYHYGIYKSKETNQ